MNDLYKLAALIAGFLGLIIYVNLLCILIAKWSGWADLARRFRHDFDFRNQIGGWQSARMRWGCSYNNALKIGASEEGLSLATIAIVPRHAPLLIPWSEIKVVRRSTFLSWAFIHLQLGSIEQIPFTIREDLFNKINQGQRLEASSIW